MPGIAGIAERGAEQKVSEMLDKMAHRGKAGKSVFVSGEATFGLIWNESEKKFVSEYLDKGQAGYKAGPGQFASAEFTDGKLILTRDELGVTPLYYGRDAKGKLCFSSEVKALLPLTERISEVIPGCSFDGTILTPFYTLRPGDHINESPDIIASHLRTRLDEAVACRIKSDEFGAWLSGGLDSSVISSLASRHTHKLKTFAAGIQGAPDLEFAREMAGFIKSEHHEIIVSPEDLVSALPQVIYHLESFDALLVRSSITNYLVGKLASDHVAEVFSGEGGDELFAGYEYLKGIAPEGLEEELRNITLSLHNTALQRVDRCASAHGTTAHVIFTDPSFVGFAFSIPVNLKIHENIEKWILRKSMEGLLPDSVFRRPKAKFWEGAGVKELISGYAESKISDTEFSRERLLPDGLILNTKEELFYYRIFREHFGTSLDLSWMGRTKGSPVA